jgi:hypothetical protein
MKTLILTEEKMHPSRAYEAVFDYFCMLVDRHTDPLDMDRHTIVAIHQAQNYAELIQDFELLTQCQLMEQRWFKGEL